MIQGNSDKCRFLKVINIYAVVKGISVQYPTGLFQHHEPSSTHVSNVVIGVGD